MVTWSEFAAAAPDIASEGRRLIEATGDAKVLLATVRGDDLPRIHPISIGVVTTPWCACSSTCTPEPRWKAASAEP
jgi:hypothetical protein